MHWFVNQVTIFFSFPLSVIWIYVDCIEDTSVLSAFLVYKVRNYIFLKVTVMKPQNQQRCSKEVLRQRWMPQVQPPLCTPLKAIPLLSTFGRIRVPLESFSMFEFCLATYIFKFVAKRVPKGKEFPLPLLPLHCLFTALLSYSSCFYPKKFKIWSPMSEN